MGKLTKADPVVPLREKQKPTLCDGSYHGTKLKPMLFEVKKDGKFKLCNYKQTKTGPFCDNSHGKLKQDADKIEA